MLKKIILIGSMSILNANLLGSNPKRIVYYENDPIYKKLWLYNDIPVCVSIGSIVLSPEETRERLTQLTCSYIVVSREIVKEYYLDGSIRLTLIETQAEKKR